MKPRYLKTFQQKIFFSALLSALFTAAAEWAMWMLSLRFSEYMREQGYRNVMFGVEGMRPSSRITFLVLGGIIIYTVSFYLQMRKPMRYFRELKEGMERLSTGELDVHFVVRGENDLAEMAASLNLLQDNIKQLMERERLAEHTKNDLVSSVAHDLRTPLTSIIGYLGWVRTQKEVDSKTREKYIDIAYNKAVVLERLTNELFGFVKLEHKELVLHVQELDLVQLMQQMMDENFYSFEQNGLKARFICRETVLKIEADGALLARLFSNLLNNAVKYGKEGKQIRVEMERQEDMAVTRVINYGHVIPQEKLEAVFQKFYRVENSRSKSTGGSGLGLAIVSQIVKLHCGRVEVRSGLDGTVFEVVLPLRHKE